MRKRYWAILTVAVAIGIFGNTGISGQLFGVGAVVQAAEEIDTAGTEAVLAVSMSKESGCYDKEFALELHCEGADRIYYTTDGSNPVTSDSRIEYTGAITVSDRKDAANVLAAVDPVLFDSAHISIEDGEVVHDYGAPKKNEVDKATVVRAVGVDTEGNYSSVTTNTYFVGAMSEHIKGIEESCKAAGIPLSIMSVSVDYKALFDHEKGIYVKGKVFEDAFLPYKDWIGNADIVDISRKLEANYSQRGQEWERAAHIDYLESDGVKTDCKLQQDCGIRIQGNYSRSDLQKGFRLYARDTYGKKDFEYAFFGEDAKNDNGDSITKFRKLTLRNGGNTAFLAKYNDAFWQSLLRDTACETQASRACIVYLDGEYWGIYILQEDYDDHYFENTHGVDNKSVVVYKGDAEKYESGYKLDEGELPAGVTDEGYYLEELMQFFKNHSDLKKEEDYQAFEKLVDVDSVRDYFAAQIWINNKWDWPGKNWSMWKTASVDASNPYADGRWRLCLYDLDFGGWSGYSESFSNTIREGNYKPYGLLDMDTENPTVLCFAYLMTNKDFRESFAARLLELDSKNFEKASAKALCEKYRDIYQPLYLQFFTRYFGAESGEFFAEHALTDAGTYKTMTDYIDNRSESLSYILEYVNTFYKTHSTYNSNRENEEDTPSKIKSLSITAKKGKTSLTVKTLKKAKVTVEFSKKLIRSGKKSVKKLTIAGSKNKTGKVTIKLSSKLKKGMKVTVTVAKSGYQTTKKSVKVK